MTSQDRRTFLAGAAAGTAAVVGSVAMSAIPAGAAAATSSTSQTSEKAMHAPTDHTTFAVENTAVVLVDHQVGTIGWAGELASEEELNQLKMWVRVMARFAKSAGMPVVLTSSLETEAQGPLLPEFKDILPQEYAARIQRTGVINAWDDPAFAKAVRATGRKNLIMGGLTTDVCLVPPALSAKAEGFNVVALLDISAACTKTAAQNSRDLLQKAGIEIMTVTPMITSMLGNYKNPASGGFFGAFEKEGVYGAFAKGNLR
jgi:nicotinamidase-related amidase